jgi:hypothetical protein
VVGLADIVGDAGICRGSDAVVGEEEYEEAVDEDEEESEVCLPASSRRSCWRCWLRFEPRAGIAMYADMAAGEIARWVSM